jgi:energy-coupling factor transporter ATP-binding protein EcfA2
VSQSLSTAESCLIQVQDLHVRYPDAHALKGINLTISPGSFVLLGGPSGSGKSTLARTLLGLIPQTIPANVTGHILTAGLDPRCHNIAQIATRVGMTFQNPAMQLFNATVEEELAFGPRNLGLSAEEIATRVEWALNTIDGTHLRRRAIRRLSSGEQQRVAIAAALTMEPNALILDEPTANLDAAGVRRLVQTLVRLHRQYRVTLIVIEHRLAPFIPHADRLVWLKEGHIVADGSPAEIERFTSPAPLAPPSPLPASRPLVSLHDVAAGYDGHPVIRKCSLTLHRGDFAALVGPNGSGKTTVARVLAGLLRPRRGSVKWHTNGHRPRAGLMQQNPLHQMVCDTVAEEVSYGPHNLGDVHSEVAIHLLTRMGLEHLKHRPTRALSVGQQQRTVLAATLALTPSLLILDEPTVGQDQAHLTRAMDFVSNLNREGQAVLLITHDRRLVERYAGKVWEMKEGTTQEARCTTR